MPGKEDLRMPGVDLCSATSYFVAIAEIAASKGIRLTIGSDFTEFQTHLDTQSQRHVLSPMFDARKSSIPPEKAFWIAGFDENNELVHTQAMRLIDLSGSTLDGHLEQHFCDYRPGTLEIDESRSAYIPTPGLMNIAGHICYHGELWLKSGPRGYRGTGLTAVLPRLALALGLLRWSPDFIFGFMFPIAACRGLAAREGYMHLEPGCIEWGQRGDSDLLEEWLVWMSRADLDYLVSINPGVLYEKIEATVTATQRRKVGAKDRLGKPGPVKERRLPARATAIPRAPQQDPPT